MAPASGDCENSWPSIVVNRALSASISGAALARRTASRCSARAAADLGLDGVDRLQAFDHLVSERRLRRLVHLDEFAPGMRQTKSQSDRTAMTARQRLVGGIAVHLQNAGEAGQLPGDLVGAAA